MYDFTGKVAVVTGAAMGIGKATALRVAGEGADVALLDLPDRATGGVGEAHEASHAEAEAKGVRAVAVPCDVSDPAAVEAAFARVLEELGHVDFVVNVAGIADAAVAFEDVRSEDLDRVLAVNVRGTLNVDQAAVRIMKAQRSGRIVNLSSINGITGYPGPYAYNASKFAVTGLTQTLAAEMGPFGVNVNCVCPGFVWTPMWQANDRFLWESEHPGEEYVPMTYYQRQCDTTMLGRPTYPEDVAAAIAWLLSDEARNLTGQHVNVDCGLELH